MSDSSPPSDDVDETNTIDPTELYTMDDFIAEQNIFDGFAGQIAAKFKATMEAGTSRRRSAPRRYINRPREECHQRLVADYFCDNPLYNDKQFRRRFRMTCPLFLRVVSALSEWSPYFTQRSDCTNREGLSPLQKCTAAIRMLAYGSPVDQLDEYLKIGESTSTDCLNEFTQGVIDMFSEEYMRRPRAEDLERLLQVGESRGFPGMLGSIDCMHWRWEKCPVAWNGQFTRGDHGGPTVILESAAAQNLWFWHAFFRVAGSSNDINVLNRSPLFVEELRGHAPRVQYHVNGNEYNTGYYLVDGIYPEWAVFVKTIHLPQTEKYKMFARHQEGARKDVERAFAALQHRFSIV